MKLGGEQPEGVPTPDEDGTDPRSLEPDDPPADEGPEDHGELLPSGGPLRTVMKALGYAEQSVGVVLIAVILVLVLVQVAQRYVESFGGWPWTGEVARLSLVWCTFALTGYLMSLDRHITIKVIDLALPERVLDFVKLGAHLVVLATCLGMGYATYRLIADDIGQRTPAAEIPLALVYVMPMLGYFLTALRAAMVIGLLDLPQIVRPQRKAT